jgi:hypothetical protein
VYRVGESFFEPPGSEHGVADFSLALERAKVLEPRWWEDAGQNGLTDKSFLGSLWSRLITAPKYSLLDKAHGRGSVVMRSVARLAWTLFSFLVSVELLLLLGTGPSFAEEGKGIAGPSPTTSKHRVYTELDRATMSWTPAHREALILSVNQIATLYNTNNLPAGLAAAERLLVRQRERFGDQHLETALVRGMLAIGLARAGRDAEALNAFKQAIPVLLSGFRETDTDDAIETAAREQRLGVVLEAYIALLSRSGAADATAESFRLADLLRGRYVQRALAASSARAAVGNPALAGLVRKAQDLEKQVTAELNVLNNALKLPSEQRDDKAVKALATEIEKLRAARDAANRDVASRFPKFAALADPVWSIKWNGERTYSSWHRELIQAPELRQQVAKRLRLPRSADRSAQNQSSGLNLGRAITPPLGDNNAGAHPIARGIEQAAARVGYSCHEGTAARYPSPGGSAQHDNVRRIRLVRAAGSARQTGSPWTSTPPSPT